MKKTVAIIGCGSLGTIVGEGIVKHLRDTWELIGVYNRSTEKGEILANRLGCRNFSSLDELFWAKPDVVVEATTVEGLKQVAKRILDAGSDLIPLAIGAFADETFKRDIEKTASLERRHVHFVAGAIGGFDLMQATVLKSPLKAKIISTKSPFSLQGAPGLKEPLPLDKEVVAFKGSASDAIVDFPKNVNVAIALSLATNLNPTEVEVEIHSVPGLVVNSHQITIVGEFGSAEFTINSKPSKENPKSSETAALSVVAKLKNLASPFTF